MAKKRGRRRRWIPLKKNDNLDSVRAVALATGGEVKKVKDIKTGKVVRAIVWDE